MWTTERPKEAGFYYFRANKFDLPNEPLRVLEYAFPYEGGPLEDHVGYTVAERLELQPDCEWLRVPSPDKLAALLRLAETVLAEKAIRDRMAVARADKAQGDLNACMMEYTDAMERYEAALDAVKEAE